MQAAQPNILTGFALFKLKLISCSVPSNDARLQASSHINDCAKNDARLFLGLDTELAPTMDYKPAEGFILEDEEMLDVENVSDWSADSEQFFELEDLEQNSENEQNLQMFELEECDKLMPEHRWVPGHSMGTSVGRLGQGVGNLSAQSQMLLVNVFYSLKRLPVEMVKNLCVCLLPFQEGVKVKPWAAQAASMLCRVAGNSIRALVRRLKKNHWEVPEPKQPQQKTATPENQKHFARSADEVMKFLVSQILANAYEAGSDLQLLRQLARFQSYGIDCGDKCHSPDFFRLVEYLAAQIKLMMDAEDFDMPLPGTGIRSHFALIFDSVSLGTSSFSRHETLLVLGVSCISGATGTPHARLFGCPSVGRSHKGAATAGLIVESLLKHPANITATVCANRLCSIGGDGAVVRGGESARHVSTDAAGHVWERYRPNEEKFCEWDPFHREDICRKRAFRSCKLGTEMFDVAQAMTQLFGVGAGRVILRSAASSLRVPVVSGTRPTVALEGALAQLSLTNLTCPSFCGEFLDFSQ